MTNDQIVVVEAAIACGATELERGLYTMGPDDLLAFATKIREAGLNEAAQICDANASHWDIARSGPKSCAADIRSLIPSTGEQNGN